MLSSLSTYHVLIGFLFVFCSCFKFVVVVCQQTMRAMSVYLLTQAQKDDTFTTNYNSRDPSSIKLVLFVCLFVCLFVVAVVVVVVAAAAVSLLFLCVCLVLLCNLRKTRIVLPGQIRHSSRNSSASHSYEYVQYFWWPNMARLPVFGIFNVNTLFHAGAVRRLRESLLRRDSNPRQYCALILSRTLYPLSYPYSFCHRFPSNFSASHKFPYSYFPNTYDALSVC